MMRLIRIHILGALLSILAIGGCNKNAEDPCNFVLNSKGERVSWRQAPIRLYLHNNVPQDMAASFIEATEIWNAAFKKQLGFKSNFFYVDNERVNNLPNKDGVSVVYFESNWAKNIQDKQAVTSVHWMGKRINEADIVFNSSTGKGYELSVSRSTEPSKLDFVSLAIHELGHVAGLGHIDPKGNLQSTVMAERLAKGQMRRTPSPEMDLSSLKCEY